MKRKDFLKKGVLGAGTLAGGLSLLSSCETDKKSTTDLSSINVNYNKEVLWRMITVWGKNFPVLGESANLLSQWVDKMSGGRFKIKVFGSGELVPGLESFNTTSAGTTEMGAGASYYWQGKSPATIFFTTIPFGMNAQQLNAWLHGGDQEGYNLWKEVYAPFNLTPFAAGNSGVQMGGWFNREINTPEDLKGLKMRIPGIAGKVLEKAGGAAITVSAGEIYTNLERGVIDATEWIGPYHDYTLGLHRVAKYYYAPGWHEPGSLLEFFANTDAYNALPTDLQEILKTACFRVNDWVLAEFNARNGEYLSKILESGVELRSFPDEVLAVLRGHMEKTVEELRAKSPLAKKVADSYYGFMERNKEWFDITEKAYYDKISS